MNYLVHDRKYDRFVEGQLFGFDPHSSNGTVLIVRWKQPWQGLISRFPCLDSVVTFLFHVWRSQRFDATTGKTVKGDNDRFHLYQISEKSYWYNMGLMHRLLGYRFDDYVPQERFMNQDASEQDIEQWKDGWNEAIDKENCVALDCAGESVSS